MRNLCRLLLIAVLATTLAHAQRTDANSQSRTQPRQDKQGQANPPQQQSPGTGVSRNVPEKQPEKQMDAADLQIQIQQAFQQDPTLAKANLGAYVSTDKISLGGTVTSQADKDRAQAIAQGMANGRAVDNEIRVNSSVNYISRPDSSTTTFGTSPSKTPPR